MTTQARQPLSDRTRAYVSAVVGFGALAIGQSIFDVVVGRGVSFQHWLPLATFTFISGWLSVKLPSVSASISISETFVFAGTLLCGRSVGVLLCVLDALALCAKHAWVRRSLRWEQVVFNLSAAPLSIWCAAAVTGLHEPLVGLSLDAHLVLVLGSFTLLYFLFNSWLVTLAVASELKAAPHKIWWTSFTELSVNFAAGASIAAFLVVNANTIDLTFIGVILPLLLVIYFTYRWSLKHVEAERDKVHELNRVFLSTVEALALAIDAKDQVTHGHIRRVQRFTMALASALGIKAQRELDALRAAALLHDTGKLAVPEYILNKPGPLTAAEFERMKVHADVGADILRSIDFPYPVEPIVRHHHERWDGKGYPKGLKGQEIPLGARILAVVDCYDALTSDRPYRPRMTRQQAEQELKDKKGTAYDPWIVDSFIGILDELEAADLADQQIPTIREKETRAKSIAPEQLDVIAATTAEEREFNELRRDLPRASSPEAAADILMRHLRRVVPAANVALYLQDPERNELQVAGHTGQSTSVFEGLTVAVGERISGWVFAHGQVVLNSDASLEFGPIARSLPTPLRYAVAVPVTDGRTVGVIAAFGPDPFEKDHRRVLESAATIFAASVSFLSNGRHRQDTLMPTGTTGRPLLH